MSELKPDVGAVKQWIDETFPAITLPLPEDVLNIVVEKINEEHWDPEAVSQALTACSHETVNALDTRIN